MTKCSDTTITQFRENPEDSIIYEKMGVEVYKQWYEQQRMDGNLSQALLVGQLVVESSQTRQHEPADWKRNCCKHWPTYRKWVCDYFRNSLTPDTLVLGT